MRRTVTLVVAVAALIGLGVGCATSFSPAVVRSEIARQTGADPAAAFELNLGRATLALARRVIGATSDGELPLAGLARFELAVYELPAGADELDFTRMAVRGWEPTVRSTTARGSTVVLVRGSGDEVGDVVLLTADRDQAFYARLAGSLSRELPAALAEAVSERGADGVRRELMSLAGPAGS